MIGNIAIWWKVIAPRVDDVRCARFDVYGRWTRIRAYFEFTSELHGGILTALSHLKREPILYFVYYNIDAIVDVTVGKVSNAIIPKYCHDHVLKFGEYRKTPYLEYQVLPKFLKKIFGW